MSTTTVAVVNGFGSDPRSVGREAEEYEKILKLRDEIFAGNHPRLTLPSHTVRKVSPSLSQLSSQSTANLQPVQPSQSQLPGLSITSVQEEDQNRTKELASTAQVQPALTPSGINPILLTKSDDLIKAELQLQRQRLEKQLRDQFEQKRLEFRKRPAPAEAKPDFDVSIILANALKIAKPEPREEKGDESDSFDENSYYSSKAPDSDAGDGEQSPSSHEQSLQDSTGANGLADSSTSFAQHFVHSGPVPRPSSRSGLISSNVSRPIQHHDSHRRRSANVDASGVEMDDEDEEGEYSPPEAMDQYPTPNDYGSQAVPDVRTRPMRRYSDLDENSKRPASPSEANMRIVRNHITSPLAPQPSRVSPLALTKEPPASQDRRYRNGRQRGRGASPSESPEPPGHARKKRKLDRKAEKKMRKLKQEAVSPPPFHEIQPLGSGKLPQPDDRPIVIENSPAQEIRYIQPSERYIEPPIRPISRQMEPLMPYSEPRAGSRMSMRPVRDDQDLRRVASMHSLRTEQPREYVEYNTPTRQRATSSYVRVDSPMREVHHDSAPAYDQEPVTRVVRTPGPEYRPLYHEPEPEVRYVREPIPQPAPRERIVVDQYGRRFREIIQERPAPTPRAVHSAYPDHNPPQSYDDYNNRRAGSVMIEERAPPRYEQNMPPPRMVRQVADASRAAEIPGRGEAYEPSIPMRASSVQVSERSGRQMIYADDPNDFRTPVRMGSVRPAPSQYEEPRPPVQMMPRSGSVRPGREGSVFMDDRQSRPEYIPIEQSRYRIVEPERRYVDGHGREVIPIDGGDGAVRYVQRY